MALERIDCSSALGLSSLYEPGLQKLLSDMSALLLCGLVYPLLITLDLQKELSDMSVLLWVCPLCMTLEYRRGLGDMLAPSSVAWSFLSL